MAPVSAGVGEGAAGTAAATRNLTPPGSGSCGSAIGRAAAPVLLGGWTAVKLGLPGCSAHQLGGHPGAA